MLRHTSDTKTIVNNQRTDVILENELNEEELIENELGATSVSDDCHLSVRLSNTAIPFVKTAIPFVETKHKNPTMFRNKNRMFRNKGRDLEILGESTCGMSTVEYAIGTIAAAAFGAILYHVVTGDSVVSALTSLITRALTTDVD